MIFGVCNRMLKASKRGLTTCYFMMLVEYIVACLLARYAVRAANLPSSELQGKVSFSGFGGGLLGLAG